MKKSLLFSLVFTMAVTLTGCGAIETIFKAGMWWAFILMFVVVALIIWILTRIGKK